MEDVRMTSLMERLGIKQLEHVRTVELHDLASTREGGNDLLRMMQQVNRESPQWKLTFDEMKEQLRGLGEIATETAVDVEKSFQIMDVALSKYTDTLTGKMAPMQPTFDITDPNVIPASGQMNKLNELYNAERGMRWQLSMNPDEERADELGLALRKNRLAQRDALNRIDPELKNFTININLDGHQLASVQGDNLMMEEAVIGS